MNVVVDADVIIGALILCAFPMFCALGFAWFVAVVHERATRKGGGR